MKNHPHDSEKTRFHINALKRLNRTEVPAEQVIRQVCLSSHFGMIGQRFPTADEPVSCITAIFAPPGLGCKDLI